MKLIKIVIENFKGVSAPIEVLFENFNVIVGQNDAGKSTILKAIDCFLNDTKPRIDDSNHYTDHDNVTVNLFFDPCRTEIIIDSNISTTFEDEGLVNTDGLLELRKVWDVSKSRVVSDFFMVRKIYLENDFMLFTEQQLIQICKTNGIDTRKGNDEEFNNIEKRTKLRSLYHIEERGFKYDFEKLPTRGSGRLKEVSDAINKVLPRFEYFKADTSLSESDTAIQNFFKKLSERTIREEVDTDEIEGKIGGLIDTILEKVTEKINEVVGEDEAVEPEVKFDWTKLIQTSFKSKNSGGNVPLSSRGDGFRRITMMAYFEYLAEQEATEKQNIIFGFEEPETFLHPSAQEKIFEKLNNLCNNEYQVILSTHSSILVSNTKKENLVHISKEGKEYCVSQNIQNVQSLAFDLGINVDNQFVKLFEKAKVLFLVEGIDDANAFHHICRTYKNANKLDQDFEELGIVTIPMGSCGSIKHWVSLNLLQELEKPYFIFVDSDKENEGDISRNYNLLTGEGFTEGADFLISKKRELENYIPHSYFLRERPDKNMAIYGDWDDVKEFAKRKVGGEKVARIHFPNLTFNDLESTFNDGTEDEFLKIYNILMSKL